MTSITTRRLAQLMRKPTIGGGGAIASMVECVLTWIREQYLVVCNIAKWTIFVHCCSFPTCNKINSKGCQCIRRVILMQKCKIFLGRGHSPFPEFFCVPLPSGEGDTPSPHPPRRLPFLNSAYATARRSASSRQQQHRIRDIIRSSN